MDSLAAISLFPISGHVTLRDFFFSLCKHYAFIYMWSSGLKWENKCYLRGGVSWLYWAYYKTTSYEVWQIKMFFIKSVVNKHFILKMLFCNNLVCCFCWSYSVSLLLWYPSACYPLCYSVTSLLRRRLFQKIKSKNVKRGFQWLFCWRRPCLIWKPFAKTYESYM